MPVVCFGTLGSLGQYEIWFWSMKVITGQCQTPGTAISGWPLILSQCLGVFWSLLVLSCGGPWADVAQKNLFPFHADSPQSVQIVWGA